MDKPRILPPRVRGRVTGVLDFFVDEIRLFRNILLLTNNLDFVLQVQWWGEVLPAFIRPKELHVEGKTSRKSPLLQSYYHSAQYEIKTTLDLFKAYLKNCEVLELSVLEAFENYVIGSAFLKDLINVLYSNNELIRMPIFDYLGEQIGEMVIHVNFLEKPHQDKDKIQNKSTEILNTHYIGKIPDKEDYSISNKIKSNSFTLAEKTIYYNGHSKKNLHKEEGIVEMGLPIYLQDFRKNEKTADSSVSLSISDTSNKLLNGQENKINNEFVYGNKETSCGCLPEIQTVNDSSKILYFGVTSQQSRNKTVMKKSNVKVTNKFNSNSIKCKSKHPEKLNAFSSDKPCKKSITKKPECLKNLTKNLTKTKKEMEFDFKVSPTSSKCVKSEIYPLYEVEDLKSIPSRSPNVKVLDYLLGSHMSKEEEQTALNDLKKMSPSHNLVDSISQLCLVSSKDSQKSVHKDSTNSPISLTQTTIKQNFLNFDFNNPIERKYYKTFFLKSNPPPDFEIAELLNQPENNATFGKFKEISQQNNKPWISSEKNTDKNSLTRQEEMEAKDCILNISDRRSNCARCKYYKKLSELDTIIGSLKHFEEKILSHEKELQSAFKGNCDNLNKRSQH